MSWLLNLVETYEANETEVGEVKKNRFDRDFMLLPIAHTTQNAHIEVRVTPKGDFHSASVVNKEEATTILPSTVDSSNRAGSAIAPYALHDKLNYTAGDFADYGGKVGKGDPHKVYLESLSRWVKSEHSHPHVVSIYNYVKKGKLIEDLVKAKIIYLDEHEKMLKKWQKKLESVYGDRPEIFSVITGDQESAFVRFCVHSPNENLQPPWRNKEIFNAFLEYYPQQIKDKGICFVTGETVPTTEKHANKIRHAADKAKLISGNDTSGFTFRGRFNKSGEAASIGYETSQKAHNALKWLIEKQGVTLDGRVFLIWGNDQTELPQAFANTPQLGTSFQTSIIVDTLEYYATEFSKALAGYKSKLYDEKDLNQYVNIMIIDAATTGRLGVLYYRELNQDDYLERMKAWHISCAWRHRYYVDKQWKEFVGAPSTRDIALAAYGSHANDKLIKGTMERLLPSIIDGARVPKDIERSLIQRASNPVAMEPWEWEKTLSTACSIVNREEQFEMTVDQESKDRDYLFGRLLALADVLERRALSISDAKRTTNAIRYMNAFAKHPARTWQVIQQSIQPYQMRLGPQANDLIAIIDEVGSKLQLDDFNDQPLSGKYLLGLYSQRHALYNKNKVEKGEK